MAYNAITPFDEAASDSGSDTSRSSFPIHDSFQQVREIDNPGSGSYLETAKTDDSPSLGLAQLSAMISSMTTTPSSYDVIEADDYDVDPSSQKRSSSLHRSLPPLNTNTNTNTNTAVARHSSPEAPLHSASIDLPTPLNHPTPDLQSLQGAYIGNVERLEQSAERMSSSSADIGSEIRKMDLEQKRRSCSSASNSVVIRNAAFSSGAIAFPIGSTMSTRPRSVSGGSRLAQVAEPDHDEDGHFLDHLPAPLQIFPAPQIPVYTQGNNEIYYGQHGDAGGVERPSSVASGDTYQQARTLFTDFDGVHFTPLGHANSGRQISLSQPPLASKPESYKEPQSGEHMVYYPAPVPRTLNLPPKLSRKPIADREKRRTQIVTSIAAEDMKLASAQTEPVQKHKNGGQNANRLSTAPPQLRASVFFDRPSTTLEVEVKQDSAVATLESILDASANAPVSAFTDHPYAGHVGSYVYGTSKRKTLCKVPNGPKERHSQRLMGHRHSTAVGDDHERSVADLSDRSHHESDSAQTDDSEPESDNTSTGSGDGEEEEGEEEEEEEEEELDYVGPPNTLLAELELRKQELKQRRRTALPISMQGMQTTLLEMDAMAQKKSEKRRQRPVTLAWDNRDTADDDDVPLAMLYPDKTNAPDETRPLGLMERRQLEENEPLSARRARLRGEPIPEKRPVAAHVAQPPEPEVESGDEGETLAERLRRLKGQNPKESHFAHELLAEFDKRAGVAPKEPETPSEEETLAQRRSRLQKQNLSQNNARNPRMRKSMAALPQSRAAPVSRKMSHDVLQQPTMMQQYGRRMSMQSLPANMTAHNAQAGYPMQQPYGYGMANQYAQSSYGFRGYNMPIGCGPAMARQQPIDRAQHDVIDRWRQSIR